MTLYLDDDNNPVARQSVSRPGERSQSYSIYCHICKCQVVKEPAAWPDGASIHKWLFDGMHLLNNNADRLAHKRVFPVVPKA